MGEAPFGIHHKGRLRNEWLLTSKAFDAALTGITSSAKARAMLADAGLIVTERQGVDRRYVVKRKVGVNKDGTAQVLQVTAIDLEKLVQCASSRQV